MRRSHRLHKARWDTKTQRWKTPFGPVPAGPVPQTDGGHAQPRYGRVFQGRGTHGLFFLLRDKVLEVIAADYGWFYGPRSEILSDEKGYAMTFSNRRTHSRFDSYLDSRKRFPIYGQ